MSSLSRVLVTRSGLTALTKAAQRATFRGGVSSLPTPAHRGLHYAAANGSDADLQAVLKEKPDLLIVGCGVAGSSAALKAAEQGLSVVMVTSATDPRDCNSYWAQGGIIYKANDDSPSLLAQDIFIAGANVNDKGAVKKLAEQGPHCVEDLLINTAKVPFDRNKEGNLALCLEASHNRARIIHWRDHTGRAITESLLKTVVEHPTVLLLSGVTAVDLAVANDDCSGRVMGAHLMRSADDAKVVTARAKATLLATGGLGEIYEHTSNPPSARGDGFAMALRAGAALQNMEFVQFHPTTLYLPGERSFLLTEALRGEGARLLNNKGRAFAKSYHPAGELAPRDVVSRMIVSEMAATGSANVYLDISHRDATWLRNRFPAIYKHCMDRGLDMTREPLPVVPAAHYFCGGVATDLNGQTTVPGLYAAGEVACTGLHGANRLASTSLLEGVVWGTAVAQDLAKHQTMLHDDGFTQRVFDDETPLVPIVAQAGGQKKLPTHDEVEGFMKQIRSTMWEHVGVVRRKDDLSYATTFLKQLEDQVEAYYRSHVITKETVSLRNAIQTARLIAKAAERNKHSVGAHYIEDGLEEEEDVVVAERKAAMQ